MLALRDCNGRHKQVELINQTVLHQGDIERPVAVFKDVVAVLSP
jgi:hypothetical protein